MFCLIHFTSLDNALRFVHFVKCNVKLLSRLFSSGLLFNRRST